MDIDTPSKTSGRESRYAFVTWDDDGSLQWGQDHDTNCVFFKAQSLIECVLLSWVEMRLMRPQSDWMLAFLIAWAAEKLHVRQCLPQTAEDIVNIFGIFEFFWHERSIWFEDCVDEDGTWNLPFNEALESFSFPAATSIFVYRKGSVTGQ